MKVKKMIGKAMAAAFAVTMMFGGMTVMAAETWAPSGNETAIPIQYDDSQHVCAGFDYTPGKPDYQGTWFVFTPEHSGSYIFESTGAPDIANDDQSVDPNSILFDSEMNFIEADSRNDDTDTSRNFGFSANLEAGQPYYFYTGDQSGNRSGFDFSITNFVPVFTPLSLHGENENPPAADETPAQEQAPVDNDIHISIDDLKNGQILIPTETRTHIDFDGEITVHYTVTQDTVTAFSFQQADPRIKIFAPGFSVSYSTIWVALRVQIEDDGSIHIFPVSADELERSQRNGQTQIRALGTPSPETSAPALVSSSPVLLGTENFIDSLYVNILNRNADSEGRAYWINILNAKELTGSDVAADFFSSEEFARLDLNNEQFVAVAYKVFCNRTPDSSEIDNWVTALNNGATRAQVIAGFTGSSEWSTTCSAYGVDA